MADTIDTTQAIQAASNPSWWDAFKNYMYKPAGQPQPVNPTDPNTYDIDGQGNMVPRKPQASLMGMTPNSFAATIGQLGAAFAPKGSWQEKVGMLAAQLGNAQLMGEIEKRRAGSLLNTLKQSLAQPETTNNILQMTPASPEGRRLQWQYNMGAYMGPTPSTTPKDIKQPPTETI